MPCCELDAMIGTLELVARSDWVTVLPSLISANDIRTGEFTLNPIDPPMHAEFVAIRPSRRALSTQARLFLDRFKAEVAQLQATWQAALTAPAPRRVLTAPSPRLRGEGRGEGRVQRTRQIV